MSRVADWLKNLVERYEPQPQSGARRHFTMQDVQTDPWSAIDLSIPPHAHVDVLRQAKVDVDHCLAQLTDPTEGPVGHPSYGQKEIADRMQQVTDRGVELDRMIQSREERLREIADNYSGKLQDDEQHRDPSRGGRGR